jgi:type I restriction enzyme S subunit
MEIKAGYKQTEVGVIPEDWDVAQLNNLCSMKSGEGITSANIYQFSKYPCYGGNGLRGFTSRFTHNGTYALIGRQGALCGNVLGVCGKFFASEHAIVVTAKEQTDVRWLTFVLGQMRLNRYSESSAQPGLSVSKLLKLAVACPPTEAEQTTIATTFSDADALITNLQELVAKKRLIRQGTMQYLLTGKKRLPGFSGEWETKKLVDLTDCLDNLRIPLNDGLRAMIPGDIPYCGANGILDYIDDYIIEDNIILIAEDGGYFDEYAYRPIAYRMTGKCWVNNHAHILKAKPGINQDFIFYSLVHKNILKYLTSGTRAKLNKFEMYKIEIAIPKDEAEQNAISQVLSDMDAEIEGLERKLEKYKMIKLGMMQELLTGKKRLI